MKLTMFLTIACTALLAFGCGDDETSDPGIKQTVNIVDWIDGSAVKDVELCWAVNGGEKSCLTTGEDGTAVGTADVSAGDSLVLSGTKAGFYPFQATYVISANPSDSEVNLSLVADSIVDLLVGELGEAADAAKGHITALVLNLKDDGTTESAIGASVELVEGKASKGPNYTNRPEDIGMGLFAKDGKTTAAGIAVFNNVDPGTAKLKVTLEGKTCAATAGVPTGENQVSATIAAGIVTYTIFACQ